MKPPITVAHTFEGVTYATVDRASSGPQANPIKACEMLAQLLDELAADARSQAAGMRAEMLRRRLDGCFWALGQALEYAVALEIFMTGAEIQVREAELWCGDIVADYAGYVQ